MKASSRNILQDEYPNIKKWVSILWTKRFQKLFAPLNIDYEDFEAEAFLLICKNIDKYDPVKAKLSTFLTAVLNNKLKSWATYLNRNIRKADTYSISINTQADNEMEIADLLQAPTNIEYEAEEKENAVTCVSFLYCLPLREQEIAIKLFSGVSIPDISVQTGYSIKAVKNIIRSIRENVQLNASIYQFRRS